MYAQLFSSKTKPTITHRENPFSKSRTYCYRGLLSRSHKDKGTLFLMPTFVLFRTERSLAIKLAAKGSRKAPHGRGGDQVD